MHAISSTVMYIWDPPTQHRSRLFSSHRETFARSMASMPGMNASFTTQVLHTGCGEERWNKFLSSVSREAELSGFDPSSDVSIVAKWWTTHARVWAGRAIAS